MPHLSIVRSQAKAIQAVVALLNYLNLQWCFQEIECDSWDTTSITYNFCAGYSYNRKGCSGNEYKQEIFPEQFIVHVNLLRILGRYWIATSAEIDVQNENEKMETTAKHNSGKYHRCFKFKWAEGGKIKEIQEIEINNYEDYQKFAQEFFDYDWSCWPCSTNKENNTIQASE